MHRFKALHLKSKVWKHLGFITLPDLQITDIEQIQKS